MSLIADGLLIATCLTTALYCLVLSRRLRRLSDTDDGIGKQILRLNTALAETKAAVAEIRMTTKTASEDLERDIEAAKRQGQQLQSQIARALKSGVGAAETSAQPKRERPSAPAATASAVTDLDDAAPTASEPRTAVEDRARSREAEAESPPVVDFDAAETVEDDDDLGREPDEHKAGDSAAAEASEDARYFDEEEDGDIASAKDHWPFEEDEEPSERGLDAEEEALAAALNDDDEAERLATRRRGAARRVDSEEADAGLLRVERMAV